MSFDVQLSNPPQEGTSATVQVEVNGITYDVAVDANGAGTLTLDGLDNADVYNDSGSYTATVTGVTGGNFENVITGQSTTATVTETLDVTTVSITGTITTPSTIDVSNVEGEPNGINVYALDLNGNVQDLSIVSGTNHDGFGVNGKTSGSGASSELGFKDGNSEKIVVDFDTDVKSLDVAFAWRNNTESAKVTFFDEEGNEVGSAMVSGGGNSQEALVTYYDENGNVTKTETAQGGSDKVDLEYKFEPGNGQTFSKVEFSAPGYDDDYLINKITYKEVVSSDVTDVVATNAEVTLEIQTSNPPQAGTTAIAVVEVAGQEYQVQLDTNGRGTLNVEVNGNEELTATVKEIIGGNFEAVDVSSANWELATELISLDDSISVTEDQTYYLDSTDFGDNQVNVSEVQITELPLNGTLYMNDGNIVETIVTNEGKEINVYDNKQPITEGTVITMADIAAGKVTFEPEANSDEGGSFKFKVGDGNGNFANVEHTTTINVTGTADAPLLSMNIGEAIVIEANPEPQTTTFTNSQTDKVEGWWNTAEYDLGGTTNSVDITFKDLKGNKEEEAKIELLDQDGNVVDTIILEGNNGNGIETHTFTSEQEFSSIKISGNSSSDKFEVKEVSAEVTITDGNIINSANDYWTNNEEINGTEGSDTINIGTGDNKDINAGAGDDVINTPIQSGNNLGTGHFIDGGDGNDTLVIAEPRTGTLNGNSYEYRITDNGDGTTTIQKIGFNQYQEWDLNHYEVTTQNVEKIQFTDGTVTLGSDSSSPDGTETMYLYTIALQANVTDTDGSETLSAITITNLPEGTSLKDMTPNEDGSYTVEVDENGNADVTLVSNAQLDTSSLNGITASISATETNSGDVSTVTVNENGIVDIQAGSGDDTIEMNSADVENTRMDGGEGEDTLSILDEGEINLDLENLSSIEIIDMTNNQENNLNLDLQDMLQDSAEPTMIKILGDDADSVNVTNDEGFEKTTVTQDGNSFDVLSQGNLTIMIENGLMDDHNMGGGDNG